LFLEDRNGVVYLLYITMSYMPFFGNFMHRCLDWSYIYNQLLLRKFSSNANGRESAPELYSGGLDYVTSSACSSVKHLIVNKDPVPSGVLECCLKSRYA
jgi:hypothetical protein